MTTVGVIQARMGSNRLPGKVMLALDCDPVIHHMIERSFAMSSLDTVIVATTEANRDNIIAKYADRMGVSVFRGSEDDVLGRTYNAAVEYDADDVVRITGDCPLLPPSLTDAVVGRHETAGADYTSNMIKRTFPWGFGIETCTIDSLDRVITEVTDPRHKEHVTLYYRDNPESFHLVNVTSGEVYDEPWMRDRTDLRLTLDTPADYELLHQIYEALPRDGVIDAKEAIKYVDRNDLYRINQSVTQKSS